MNKSIKEIKHELECTHKQLIENYKKELIEHRKNRLLKQILEIEKAVSCFIIYETAFYFLFNF